VYTTVCPSTSAPTTTAANPTTSWPQTQPTAATAVANSTSASTTTSPAPIPNSFGAVRYFISPSKSAPTTTATNQTTSWLPTQTTAAIAVTTSTSTSTTTSPAPIPKSFGAARYFEPTNPIPSETVAPAISISSSPATTSRLHNLTKCLHNISPSTLAPTTTATNPTTSWPPAQTTAAIAVTTSTSTSTTISPAPIANSFGATRYF
ncbi:hypothetical protein QYM36_000945, partial [Artemia franciscana]